MEDLSLEELIDYAWVTARIPKSEYIEEKALKKIFDKIMEQIMESMYNQGKANGGYL